MPVDTGPLRIVDLNAKATPGPGDLFELVDVSDTTDAKASDAQGSSKQVTFANFAAAVLGGLTSADVGLGNVTNNAQTKAAIVPNTLPAAGQILVGNAGGTAYAPESLSGDGTLASTGALTLATVNSNVGSFTSANITVDAKGRVTAAANGSGGTTYSADGVTLALTGTTFSIHTGGVGTSQLASGAVSYVKIQNVAAAALLGNPTGSAAAPSEITLGTGLSFSGTTLTATGGSGGTAVSYSVNQTAHGFSVGNWLKLVSANTYALAKADAAANADYMGVVSTVTDANNFILTISGEVTLSSLTVGNYFGSPTTAGAMATSAPTSAGQVQILLGRAISTTVFVVEIKQGMVLSSLTNHGVVVGTGTGVTATATGATGVPLIGQGGSADPVFQGTGVKLDSHFGAITADTDASTVTMDLSVSDWHTLLLTSAVGGNRTLALSNPTVGQQFAVVLQQPASGGPCTVTWFSGILWSGGTVPTLTTTASKRDVFGFKCIATGVYLGFLMGPNF